MAKPKITIDNLDILGLTEKINKLRMDLKDKTLTNKMFISLIKEYGLYSGCLFWNTLLRYQVIVRVNVNEYGFNNPKHAIHYKLMKNVLIDFLRTRSRYSEKEKRKREREKGPDPQIMAAVSLLKSKGFQLYAPIGNYFEKL